MLVKLDLGRKVEKRGLTYIFIHANLISCYLAILEYNYDEERIGIGNMNIKCTYIYSLQLSQ